MNLIEVLLLSVGCGIVFWLTLLILSSTKHKETFLSKPQKPQKATLPQYSTYKMSILERIIIASIASSIMFIVGFIFYQNWLVSTGLSVLGLFYPRIHKKSIILKRKKELAHQFQQALFSLSSSLVAGRSIENAFQEVIDDLKMIYPHPSTFIVQEFEMINRRIQNGETIERGLEDFSTRASIEDIQHFKDVFIICKRSGGQLVEVMRRAASIIGDKIDMERDIYVMIAQKRLEAKILSVAPFAMVGLLAYMAADYMAPLYEWSEFGPVVMSISLAILLFSFWLCHSMMQFKV